jgi:hypothetical protein
MSLDPALSPAQKLTFLVWIWRRIKFLLAYMLFFDDCTVRSFVCASTIPCGYALARVLQAMVIDEGINRFECTDGRLL